MMTLMRRDSAPRSCARYLPGVLCVFAGNAEVGLDVVAGGTFGVVVTDLCMPDMNGVAFTLRIRAMAPSITIFLFTAGHLPGATPEGLFNRVFEKPRDRMGLLRAVAEALNRPIPPSLPVDDDE